MNYTIWCKAELRNNIYPNYPKKAFFIQVIFFHTFWWHGMWFYWL